ncbi:MAG: hypothetical protein Kow0031_32560 [Anaerolineae bacterium]
MVMSTMELRKYRLDATSEFERARMAARWQGFWSKIRRHTTACLLPFKEIERWLPQQRLYRGISEIPLHNIVGSVDRSHEYNRKFQPLRDSLDERWINVMVLSRTIGWPPIQAYKVGNIYFVEDGHHRVSVARWQKNRVIEAEVWEYPLDRIFEPTASLESIITQLERRPLRPPMPSLCCQAVCH